MIASVKKTQQVINKNPSPRCACRGEYYTLVIRLKKDFWAVEITGGKMLRAKALIHLTTFPRQITTRPRSWNWDGTHCSK